MKKQKAQRKIAAKIDGPEMDGSEDSFEPLRTPKPVLSENPVIAEIQLCLRRRGNVHITALLGHKYKSDKMREFIARVFNEETTRKVGILMIEAMITGNTGFAAKVEEAIKEADKLFHRNREKALLDKFAQFVWTLPEPLPANAELRTRFEKEKHNGKRLEDHQWQRLRKALNLPKEKGGRPKNARHEKRKSVS